MPGLVHPHPLALSSIETGPGPPLTPEPAVTTGARRQLSSYLLSLPTEQGASCRARFQDPGIMT